MFSVGGILTEQVLLGNCVGWESAHRPAPEAIKRQEDYRGGVFTGYSLLLTALTIPHDGKIIAIDVDREAYEIGLPFIKKAIVEHKIDFIESQALPVLDKLLENQENESSFDFAFVDADKANLKSYHERLLRLVRVGGVIVYDNTLWGSTVALSDLPRQFAWKDKIGFNKMIVGNPRFDVSPVALGDGMTICGRVY